MFEKVKPPGEGGGAYSYSQTVVKNGIFFFLTFPLLKPLNGLNIEERRQSGVTPCTSREVVVVVGVGKGGGKSGTAVHTLVTT